MTTLSAVDSPKSLPISALRRDLLTGESADMRRRRGIIGISLAGMAAMTGVALLQTGIIKRLPGLPVRGFDARRVVLSDTAFALGVPDGALSVASLAANLPLAAAGGAERARRHRWLPIGAAAKAGMESLVSVWYLRREKARCSYCLIAAGANIAIFLLALPELRRALQ
jgi:uncharacterized membrane protein